MGNKRRVWWIVAGLVLLVLAFWIIALQPTRLRREVHAVARDYGFVKVQRPILMAQPYKGSWDWEFYDAKGLNEIDIEIITARLDSACTGCKGSAMTNGTSGRGGTAWATAASGRLSFVVSVYPSSEDDVVSMDLMIIEKGRPSLWQRIKGLWPW